MAGLCVPDCLLHVGKMKAHTLSTTGSTLQTIALRHAHSTLQPTPFIKGGMQVNQKYLQKQKPPLTTFSTKKLDIA